MIKTFEQFVAAKYGKPVNEGFQSSKLRAIIKQHGLPKNDWDKKMLYDLKDNEIIDVVDGRDEYRKKYSKVLSDVDWSEEQTFIIELEDGACVVIGNLGVDKSHLFLDFIDSAEKQKDDIFKKRHSERHKGNLGKHGGDDIHKKHLEKVDEIERKRFAASLQSHLDEIATKIQSEMEDSNSLDLDGEGVEHFEFDIDLAGKEYGVEVEYEISNDGKRYGAYYYDIVYTLLSFTIGDDEFYATNDDLGMTEETYSNLFEPYTIEDMEGEIYDYYEYYGVSRKDFY